MAHVTSKPPPIRSRGFHRFWSWLSPVFKVSDQELLASSGLDALMAVRILSFGVLLLLPITIGAMAILIPINFLDDYYQRQGSSAGFQDVYTTVFIRLTMSNITPGSPLLWIHFVFVYGIVFWTCWLITEHYKEYITLRQMYVLRSVEVPKVALGGSTGSTAMDDGQSAKSSLQSVVEHTINKCEANPDDERLQGEIEIGNENDQTPANDKRMTDSPSQEAKSVNGISDGLEVEWVDHDFSQDVIPQEKEECNFVSASSSKSLPQDLPTLPEVTVTCGQPEIHDKNVLRDDDHNCMQQICKAQSNAAVVAALADSSTMSSALAVARIKHHRHISGASGTLTPQRRGQSRSDRALIPPPDLSQVIKAVVAANESSLHSSQPSGENGTPSLSSPAGQDGVGQRWWRVLSGTGNRLIERRQSTRVEKSVESIRRGQSITLKTSVPVVKQTSLHDTMSIVAVNASLYTVLVTDQPIEKLRLKRPLGNNSEFWRVPQAQLSEALVTGSQGVALARGNDGNATTDLEAAVGPTSPNRDPDGEEDEEDGGAAILKDPGAKERGIGLSSGWSSTLNGLWQMMRHRGKYREWRRDVRWAMFHKRVRTAMAMFTELFGEEFDGIIPIYPTATVDKLIHQWDQAAAALERAQFALKKLLDNPRHKPKAVVKLKSRIVELAAKAGALQQRIVLEREAVLSDLPSTCFFATFKSQKAAAIAAQANLNPLNQRLFNVETAPSPDDVNWPALTRSWWERQARPVYALPLILFIMLLPIGVFMGAFAQLAIAVCGNPTDNNYSGLQSTSWFCSSDQWAIFLRNLMTSIAPSMLLSMYHMVILPVLVYYAAQAEGQYFSLSKLDRRCADLFFYWDVFNVFLGAMLGGSVLSELSNYVNNPSQIWETLSSAIPASSNFFINFVSYRALVMAWFRLFYPHQSIVPCVLKWLRILPWAETPRDKAFEAPVRNCRYGRDIGIPVLMNFVMVLAYAVVSPLILPFGLLYFAFLWAVWRYQVLYVYQRQYESGGEFWPLVAHKVVGCAFICVLFTAVVLILKRAYIQAGIMLVTLPLYLLRFDL